MTDDRAFFFFFVLLLPVYIARASRFVEGEDGCSCGGSEGETATILNVK